MKVLWLTNVPSPYRADFFNELGRHCALEVLFEKRHSSERDRSWREVDAVRFRAVFLRGLPVGPDKAISPGVLRYLRPGRYDHIVVANPLTPTGIIAILCLKLRKIPFMIEGDGGVPKGGRGPRGAVKKLLFSGARAYFSTGAAHDAYYLAYGAKREAIRRYPFSSVFESEVVPQVPDALEKARLRSELKVPERKVVLSVGRFVPGKGFDCLLEACRQIRGGAGVYIVGGTPTADYLKAAEEAGECSVHFVGHVPKETLLRYYRMADIFVLPTRGETWGLVVGEAMACGLPVVTTDRCVAGLELLSDGENGFLVPCGDAWALSEKIGLLLGDDALRQRMAESALEKIRTYTIENMVKAHVEAFMSGHKTKLLFLGSVDSAAAAEAYSGASVAGNSMQISILSRLASSPDMRVFVLSLRAVAPFPKDRGLFYRRHTGLIGTSPAVSAEFVPFLNMPLAKQLWQAAALHRAAAKIVRRHGRCVFLSYNLYPQTGLPLVLLQKRYGCPAAAILADPPIDDVIARRGISAPFYRLFYALAAAAAARCRNLVVTNKNASKFSPGASVLVVDGGIEPDSLPRCPPPPKSGDKVIVYSGSLAEYSGVLLLLDAMALVRHGDIRLHIYGEGRLGAAIAQRAAGMGNVSYFGRVRHDEVLKIQQSAWLLVNPRPPDNPIAQVTFPSKVLEYLSSGTPVLSTRLDCLSGEYEKLMFFVDRWEAGELARRIDELADMDQEILAETAARARKFVLKTKTWDVQAEKIHRFIKEIEDGNPGA